MKAPSKAPGVLVTAVVLLALAGCTTPDAPSPDSQPESTRTPDRPAWTEVELPGDVSPVTLTELPDGLLVGARDEGAVAGRMAPRLLRLRGDAWRGVPLEPRSYYARLARWRSVVSDGRRVFALGAFPGGAHGNPRVTTWAGTLRDVHEEPQQWTTFGGSNAGGIVALALGREQPYVVGSWWVDGPGLDISLWSRRGSRWVRGSSVGTPLASADDRMVTVASAAIGPGGDLLLAGSVIDLGGGSVTERAAVWSREPTAGWHLTILPGGTRATSARCDPDGCLIAGLRDDELAGWRLDDENGAVTSWSLPATTVEGTTAAPLAGTLDDQPALLAATTKGSVIVTASGPVPGPPGVPLTWAQDPATGVGYAITRIDDRTTLWRASR